MNTTQQYLKCISLIGELLPDSYIISIITFLDAAEKEYAVAKLYYETEFLTLSFILAPLVAEKSAIQQSIDAIASNTSLLRQDLTNLCPAFGDINMTIANSTQDLQAALNNILNLINLRLAIKIKLQKQLDTIDQYVEYISLVRNIFEQILGTRNQGVHTFNITKNVLGNIPPVNPPTLLSR